jgi:hypothetical protein
VAAGSRSDWARSTSPPAICRQAWSIRPAIDGTCARDVGGLAKNIAVRPGLGTPSTLKAIRPSASSLDQSPSRRMAFVLA